MNTQTSPGTLVVVAIIGAVGVLLGGALQAWRDERRWSRELGREEERWKREERISNLSDKKRAYMEWLEAFARWHSWRFRRTLLDPSIEVDSELGSEQSELVAAKLRWELHRRQIQLDLYANTEVRLASRHLFGGYICSEYLFSPSPDQEEPRSLEQLASFAEDTDQLFREELREKCDQGDKGAVLSYLLDLTNRQQDKAQIAMRVDLGVHFVDR